MKPNLDKLIQKIGYSFVNVSLLELALTHRSYHKHSKSNERLEFLGDSILNFVIAQVLFSEHKHASEGQLSRLRANIVNRNALAVVAREHDLGNYLLLGAGELKSGGYRRDSILADTVEAIIGAIFLDSDLETVEGCIVRWFADFISKASPKKLNKDAKSILQEKLQHARHELPIYKLVKEEGLAHTKTFFVECHVSALEIKTNGCGPSRRIAEQQAAGLALNKMPKKIR